MISWTPLAKWVRGMPPEEAARALLCIGVDPAQVGRSQGMTAPGPRVVNPVVWWSLSEDEFAHRSRRSPRQLARALPRGLDLRIAVDAPAVADELIPVLLHTSDIASAFVAVDRPEGALVRRPWQWPLRVGLVGFSYESADELRQTLRGSAARLLDVHRVEEEPGAMDVAVVAGPLADAVGRLARERPVANALVVLEKSLERSAVVDAQLALARAATGATSSALIAPTDLPVLLTKLMRELSHARPFDVALTLATEREVLLWSEPTAIEQVAVPEIALRWARELTSRRVAVPAVTESAAALKSAAMGAFAGEIHEATRIAQLRETLEPVYEGLVEERWCQARVGKNNVVAAGDNPVHVFIGPLEAGAAAAPFDESGLDWEEARSYRLTVLYIGGHPEAEIQEAELELPRVGRSQDVTFNAYVSGAKGRLGGRLVILFRNRILQTTVLSGAVGKQAALTELVGFVSRLAGLDDRRAFDVALLVNHADGVPRVVRHSNGNTRISAAGGIPQMGETIAALLAKAADQKTLPKAGIRAPAPLRMLIDLAVEGSDLFSELEEELGDLRDADRIQLVSARRAWRLPIEAVYMRDAPDDDAQLCDNYLADPASCTGRCAPEDDTQRLCPNAFWGLSKVIEHYAYDPKRDGDLQDGHRILGAGQPRRKLRALRVDRTLFAASSHVRVVDGKSTLTALGAKAARATTWKDWRSHLAAEDTQLLVLLPHVDLATSTLEINDILLKRGRIQKGYVTGGRPVKPMVVLFGCRTAGGATNPTGFAQRFMQKGASVVVHSSTDLLGRHAAELARRLTAQLAKTDEPPQLLADALTKFRAEAVHDGFVMALAISAYGDADWQV